MTKNFYSLPQAIYELEGVRPILLNANNSILHKKLSQSMLDMEKIIVSHSIVYVISGTVKIVTQDYQETIVSEKEMLFMPKNSYIISDYVQKGSPMEVYLFFFDHTISTRFFSLYPQQHSQVKIEPLKLKTTNNILHYINSLASMQYKYINDQSMLEIKLLEFLALVQEQNSTFIQVLKNSEIQDSSLDIKTYMSKYYDKELSIEEWASLVGKSLSTFNRHFKKHYNISPKQWLLQENMQLAFTMLKNGKNTSECAQEFGYSNVSNFIKAYKSIHDNTPKQHQLQTSD
ncbi:Transcriptional regulator, AraC family [hydrothermal vent metagenome]|uniref:Transcriptional regulator, AraC family n=1 Tax=hydrothermal vent metagenome TaxID=652676 RepID=A0A1W1BGX0_9ZZZZ